MLGTRPLLHVCTDVLDASVLKMELRQCLEVDVKAVQRPSIEIYHVKNTSDIDHCVASHCVSDETRSVC